jgi:hypothetical protein
MRKFLLLLASVALLSSAYAGKTKVWDGTYAPAKASYMLYSGDLGEKGPPKPTDTKLSVMVEGQLAQEMFHSLGVDQKDACAASDTVRFRERGDVSCTFDTESKTFPYTCYVGVNLTTGKSMRGSIC